MSGVSLEATRLAKSFGRVEVLRNLSLSVRTGEFVAVVGQSGSGKSTLLRLLSGLERPDSGDIRVDGEAVTRPRRDARVLFQDGRLLPWLRVAENVSLGLPPESAVRASALLARVGLQDRARDWPGILSGGQKQRVALARALAAGPKLLFLDEPLGSLDALTRIEMQRLIEELWLERRFTALLITHDVEEAVALADRAVLLEGGEVATSWEVPIPRPRRRDARESTALRAEILQRLLKQR